MSGTTPRHGGMMGDGVEPLIPIAVKRWKTVHASTPSKPQRCLDVELAHNDRIVVFGEDVGVKGGVHGATVDLQIKHGADRVFDTSLSEEGIIGRAVGMAMAGLVPVPEIQFRKYLDPATEQINDAGTIRWRTNGDFAAPMVVRIPVGFSKRTGDPWHSVSGESIFAHTIGWRVAMPNPTLRMPLAFSGPHCAVTCPTFFLQTSSYTRHSSGTWHLSRRRLPRAVRCCQHHSSRNSSNCCCMGRDGSSCKVCR
ncbi:MAG: hypothetical protein IPP80_13270 [Ignavibacteria bacterium]|nr:hypothetical protein [Ignavibacteria bacterium]